MQHPDPSFLGSLEALVNMLAQAAALARQTDNALLAAHLLGLHEVELSRYAFRSHGLDEPPGLPIPRPPTQPIPPQIGCMVRQPGGEWHIYIHGTLRGRCFGRIEALSLLNRKLAEAGILEGA